MAGSSTEILESNSSLDPAIFGDALLRDMAKLWIRTLDGRSGQRRRPSPALLAAARQWQTSQEQQRRRRQQQQQQQQQQRRPAPDPAAPPPAHAENPRCWHKCSLGGEIRVLALSTEAGFAEVHAAACAKFGVSEDWRLLCRDAADAADERGADPPLITLLSDDDLAYARHRQPSLFFELAPPRDPLCSLVDVSRMSRASSSALDASSLGLSTLDEDPRTPSASGAPSALSPTPLLGAADLENDESLVTAFSALLQRALSQAVETMPPPAAPAAPPAAAAPPPAVHPPAPPPPPLAPPLLLPPPPPPPPPPSAIEAPTAAAVALPRPQSPPAPPPPPRPLAACDAPARRSTGPLYIGAAAPEAPTRKARQPKVVQGGIEAAFRKRQNLRLRDARDRVIELLRCGADRAGLSVAGRDRTRRCE